MSQADLVVGQLPEDAQVGVERVEVRDRPELVAHVVGDRRHAEGAAQRQARRSDRLDRDDLACEGRLHVHHAVAVHRPVDQRSRERLGDAPSVRDRLRVHVAREDDPRTVAERDMSDGIRPVREHRLELRPPRIPTPTSPRPGTPRVRLPRPESTGSDRPPAPAPPPGRVSTASTTFATPIRHRRRGSRVTVPLPIGCHPPFPTRARERSRDGAPVAWYLISHASDRNVTSRVDGQPERSDRIAPV